MSEVEEYIKQHTRLCFNGYYNNISYYDPWLTPDEAMEVAKIAVKEYKEQQKNQEFAIFTRTEFDAKITKAKKEIIEEAVKYLTDNQKGFLLTEKDIEDFRKEMKGLFCI